MRRILVDHARKHRAEKRGGGEKKISLTEAGEIGTEPDLDLIALDEALSNLASFDSQKSKVVELRYFGGLTAEETAKTLRVSLRTVERDWSLARAWLYRELQGDPGPAG